MKHLRLFEYLDEETFDIAFIPSGEVISVTEHEFNGISAYVILEYNPEIDAYIIEDDLRDVIEIALKTIRK